MSYSTNMRISCMLYEDIEVKRFDDKPYIPIKAINKTFTIKLESQTQEEAIEEIENICNLLVNKSNQAKLKQEIEKTASETSKTSS